jgi:hypothetical protein
MIVWGDDEPTAAPDLALEHHGSLAWVRLLTAVAREWLMTHRDRRVSVSAAGDRVGAKTRWRRRRAGSGESWTVDLYVNGSPSALTVTVSDLDTDGVVEADVAVSAGDLVRYLLTRSSTSASQPNMIMTLEFEADAAGTHVYGFRDRADWNSSGVSAGFYGEGFPSASSEHHATIVPTGTVTGWSINMADGVFPFSTTPGVGNTITYTLQKNGVDQDGTGGTVDTVLTFTG